MRGFEAGAEIVVAFAELFVAGKHGCAWGGGGEGGGWGGEDAVDHWGWCCGIVGSGSLVAGLRKSRGRRCELLQSTELPCLLVALSGLLRGCA